MAREHLGDLRTFVTVVREGSFTRAAALLGVTPSTLSHALRALEQKMGVQLLARTTRSVTATEAGQQLFENIASRFDEIDAEIAAVAEYRDKPSGTVRITTADHAANLILWPKLSKVMHEYPDISVEISVDYSLSDIVSQRFDAGVRIGDQVAKDMIAVRIGPDMRIAVVGTPQYFAKKSRPRTPQDLAGHNCIGLRLPTHGGLLPWDFDKGAKEIKVRPEGQWVFNSSAPIVRAALAGYGLAFVPEDLVLEHIGARRLVRVLDDWCSPYPGYHLYFPSRRRSSSALSVIVDALKEDA